MTDCEKFELELKKYDEFRNDAKVRNDVKTEGFSLEYMDFQDRIKDLDCCDKRLYYYRAHYFNRLDRMDEAKS